MQVKLDTSACLQAQVSSKQEQPVKAPPADIRAYLKATGLHETRYVRMLSSLCAETYYLTKLNVRPLHGHALPRCTYRDLVPARVCTLLTCSSAF